MGLAKLKCRKCGDIIESMSHYDFKKCSCGACAVDGGDDYFRFLANEGDYEIIPQGVGTDCDATPGFDRDNTEIENSSLTNKIAENDKYFYDFTEEDTNFLPADTEILPSFKDVLDDALISLSEREQKVIRFRFGMDDEKPQTLDEVAREFDITRKRVRQIEAKALRKAHLFPRRKKCLKNFLSD